MQFGSAALSLKTFQVKNDVAELTFGASKIDLLQHASTNGGEE